MADTGSPAWTREGVKYVLDTEHHRATYKTWNKTSNSNGFHQRIFKKVYIDNEYTNYVKCILCGDTMNNVFKYEARTGTAAMIKHFGNTHRHLRDDEIPPVDTTLEMAVDMAGKMLNKDGKIVPKPKEKKKRVRRRKPRLSAYVYTAMEEKDSDEELSSGHGDDMAAIEMDPNSNQDSVAMMIEPSEGTPSEPKSQQPSEESTKAIKLLTGLFKDRQRPPLENYNDHDFQQEIKELEIKKARLQVRELEAKFERQEEEIKLYQEVAKEFNTIVQAVNMVIGGSCGHMAPDANVYTPSVGGQVNGNRH